MFLPKITAGLSVAFQTEVLADGIVTSCKRSKNLVLDVGLDMFAAYGFGDLFRNVVLGTGAKPTRRDSGTITASQAGNTVTASGAFFEAADVGRLLKFDSGAEVYITDVNSSSAVTVADSVDRPASEFTIWYVNATGHETEHSRLSSYENEQISFVAGVWTVTRTFTSPAFAAGALIKEIGWAPGGGGALLGRALIPAGGDFVGAGKKYRVTVSGSCRYGPATTQVQPDVGNNGFSTAGHFALEFFPLGPFTAALAPAKIFIGTSTRELSPLAGSNVVRENDVCELDAGASVYVSGSRSRTWSATAPVTVQSAAIRSLVLGSYAYGVWSCGIARVLLNAPQTKSPLFNLSLTFGMSWGRILIN